jgi:hypothetical protein
MRAGHILRPDTAVGLGRASCRGCAPAALHNAKPCAAMASLPAAALARGRDFSRGATSAAPHRGAVPEFNTNWCHPGLESKPRAARPTRAAGKR